MGEGRRVVSTFEWGLNQVQSVTFSDVAGIGGEQICMIIIPSEDVKAVWVGCQMLTDGVMKFPKCLDSISVVGSGRDIHSNKQSRRYDSS